MRRKTDWSYTEFNDDTLALLLGMYLAGLLPWEVEAYEEAKESAIITDDFCNEEEIE